MASEIAHNTTPIVTPDEELLGGHRPEVIVANELGIPGGPVTVEDGGDVALGATDDEAADAGGEGSVSAKLRTATAQLAALGALDDSAETDPDAETASLAALLRGLLTVALAIQTAVEAIQAVLEDVHDSETHVLNVSGGS